MNCQFCGSKLQPGVDKCPQCGASQGLEASIPPPSPYFEEAIPSTPPVVEVPEKPAPPPPAPAPVIPPVILPPEPIKMDRSMMALIALIVGVAGVPAALLTGGCTTVLNLIGIFLAWMGLKSERRGMAIAGMVLNIGTVLAVIVFYFLFAGLLAYGITRVN
jgi:hypothetical protein